MHRPGHPDELLHLLQDADTPLIRGIVGYLTAQQHAIERIVESLGENTADTKDIKHIVGQHIQQEEEFQSEIREKHVEISSSMRAGRWVASIAASALGIVGGTLVAMLVYVWNGHSADNARLADRVTKLEHEIREIAGRMTQ